MKLSKNDINISCSPNLMILTEKNPNDWTDFWHRKLTLKIDSWWFLSTHGQVNASPIKKIFSWFNLGGKNLHFVAFATVCSKSEVILAYVYDRLWDLEQWSFSRKLLSWMIYKVTVERIVKVHTYIFITFP